jgi:hypothetical protein
MVTSDALVIRVDAVLRGDKLATFADWRTGETSQKQVVERERVIITVLVESSGDRQVNTEGANNPRDVVYRSNLITLVLLVYPCLYKRIFQ